MTDQSNPPVPPGDKGSERSLFERANEAFEIKGFVPAPVPKGLAEPAPKRARQSKPASKVAAVEPPQPRIPQGYVPDPPPSPQPEPVVTAAPEPTPLPTVEPIRFKGRIHPVDRGHLRKQGMIQPEGAVTALLEEFRIVKRQILGSARKSTAGNAAPNGQRVLICSPHSGEGKTFCAVNLALAIAAERDSEVLLVDGDFAKPSVLSVLGLPGGPGFMDALSNPKIQVEDCVIKTDIAGLHVLPAGNPSNNDSEYLASERTPEVLERLTRGAPNRIVIFDSPPALAASPAAELAKFVGQAVLVVRADQTGQSPLEDAWSLLSACPDIKLLLNAVRFSPSGRRFGSYYGYAG